MHLNSVLLFKKYALPYFEDGMKVLEVAPFGHPPIYSQIVKKKIDWYYVDISTQFIGDHSNTKNFFLTQDPYRYPFKDDFFDIVFSDLMIVNVPLIWEWYKELKRIVKPNGYIITTSPTSYPPCPAPVDCWRVLPDGFIALNEYVGLKTILCLRDSLELEYFGYSEKYKNIPNFRVPAESIAFSNTPNPTIIPENRVKIFINRILYRIPYLRRFMNPVRIAYDTICIAQKTQE